MLKTTKNITYDVQEHVLVNIRGINKKAQNYKVTKHKKTNPERQA